MPDTADDVVRLRSVAREGGLAEAYAAASPEERPQWYAAAVAVAAPVVFMRLTRVYEQRRGHRSCAIGISGLADPCLDRFHDDLEAVVDDLLRHGNVPIHNLEGWITRRLQAVTVDAHRRRRGMRGALQRPRLPGWLARGLDHDPWLGQLAIEILVWVGVPATAGSSLWPLDSWAERRAIVTGNWNGNGARTVEREVERVLAVMRTRPQWFEDHVERPLGAKTAPLAAAPVERGTTTLEAPALSLVEQHEANDIRLKNLASIALSAITKQLQTGSTARTAVGTVIGRVFGELDLEGDLTTLPGAGDDTGERLALLATDPAELDRIVAVVLDILRDGGIADLD